MASPCYLSIGLDPEVVKLYKQNWSAFPSLWPKPLFWTWACGLNCPSQSQISGLILKLLGKRSSLKAWLAKPGLLDAHWEGHFLKVIPIKTKAEPNVGVSTLDALLVNQDPAGPKSESCLSDVNQYSITSLNFAGVAFLALETEEIPVNAHSNFYRNPVKRRGSWLTLHRTGVWIVN